MNSLETRNGNWLWRNILGAAIVVYILLVIFAPLFSRRDGENAFPGKLNTPDVILVSLCFLFNSGIVERLRKIQVSATEISAELDGVKTDVSVAKEELERVEKVIAELPPEVPHRKEMFEIEKAKQALDFSNKRIERVQNFIKQG